MIFLNRYLPTMFSNAKNFADCNIMHIKFGRRLRYEMRQLWTNYPTIQILMTYIMSWLQQTRSLLLLENIALNPSQILRQVVKDQEPLEWVHFSLLYSNNIPWIAEANTRNLGSKNNFISVRICFLMLGQFKITKNIMTKKKYQQQHENRNMIEFFVDIDQNDATVLP